MHRRTVLTGIFYFAAVGGALADKVFTGVVEGVALGGYDAVSYFSGSEPAMGDAAITAPFGGATYRFASAANRDAFMKSPEKYTPQYGGFCAYAAAKGALAPGDPLAWTVVNDKLYINLSPAIKQTWAKDIPGNIAKADANWPTLQ
jgi:YHS domain-containing protein